MAELQRRINEERKQLQEGIDMVEEEKNRVRKDLEKKEEELKKAQYVAFLSHNAVFHLLLFFAGIACYLPPLQFNLKYCFTFVV